MSSNFLTIKDADVFLFIYTLPTSFAELELEFELAVDWHDWLKKFCSEYNKSESFECKCITKVGVITQPVLLAFSRLKLSRKQPNKKRKIFIVHL